MTTFISSPHPEQLVILKGRRTGTQPAECEFVGDLRAGECRVWQQAQSLLLFWDPGDTGVWCGAEPAGNLGRCLDTRQGRKMCRSGENGSIKPVHITMLALQTALEQSCSAEGPVLSITSIKERGQLRRLSVLYTCKLCSELRLGSVLFINNFTVVTCLDGWGCMDIAMATSSSRHPLVCKLCCYCS